MGKSKHKCSNINPNLLPKKVHFTYYKLRDYSNDFSLMTPNITYVLDKFYDNVEKRYPYAIIDHNHFKFPLAPLSMQGDSAVVRKVNGDELHLYPKNLKDFKMIEFAKEIRSPFKYTLVYNLAIYYSTATGLKLNKNVSDRYKMKFYGDVIIVPQDLMPKL